ncbi:MAG: ABC transporter permease [Treponema sp.]|jgi:lipoprotein-releasing system permease protein|nr:ABC transporter permease [Treponema sp.]
MKSRPEFFIALRCLLGRAREGGRYLRGAAAGIALSLVPIIVTMIVADGMIRGITDRYLELGTGHIRIYDYRDIGERGEDGQDKIAGFPGIRGVWTERQGLGVVMSGKGGAKAGATIRAVDPSFWTDEGSRRFLKTIAGSAELSGGGEVLLGEELARIAGAAAGDTVYIMSVRVAPGGRNIPRTLPFIVRGIVSSGYRELDALWCIMDYESGLALLAPELSQTFITAKIAEPYRNAGETALLVNRALGSGYRVYTWKDIQRAQYSSYESTRQLLLFIMALIVLVAAVNVSSATSMLVIERQRDIAVLKAAGASPSAVSRIFLWASFLTGFCGAVPGIAAGLLIGRFINPIIHGIEKFLNFFSGLFSAAPVRILDPGYYLEVIPIIIDSKAVFLIGFFTVLCSVLAAWMPSRRAGKIRPLELLRRF